MTEAQLLTALKTNLKITTGAYDERLEQLLTAARDFVIREGVSTLDTSSSFEDAQIVVMYAQYLWGQRDNVQAPMPRMLRWALNNRIFAEKAAAEGS